jgi:hypothetical protein
MIPTGIEFWISFIIIGVVVNICSSVVLHVVKQCIAFSFTKIDIFIFINFCNTNRNYIRYHVTKRQKFLYYLFYFVPFYTCYLNIINMFFCIKHGGAKGIVIGKIRSEQFRFYPLINYNLNYK